MIITEPTKTGTELMFFFDLRILITFFASSNASYVIVEKAKVTRTLRIRHQSKLGKCHKQKESSLRMVSGHLHDLVTCYGIYLSQMMKDMFCFLSSQSDSFLIHDLISFCSHNNTTGATRRAAHKPIPSIFFNLV